MVAAAGSSALGSTANCCNPSVAARATVAAIATPAKGRMKRGAVGAVSVSPWSSPGSSSSATIRSRKTDMPASIRSPRMTRPIARYSAACCRSSRSWHSLRSSNSASFCGSSPSTKAEICIFIASFIGPRLITESGCPLSCQWHRGP